jgi:hypothetical protein
MDLCSSEKEKGVDGAKDSSSIIVVMLSPICEGSDPISKKEELSEPTGP